MKYIQLSYEDVACDNSWKEGVDKGWPALFHELIKSSKDEASKDEAMLVKYPSMWCKKAMRKESPSRKECKASIFLSVMCLSFNAPMWPKLSPFQGQDRFPYMLPFQFSSVLPAQKQDLNVSDLYKMFSVSFSFPFMSPVPSADSHFPSRESHFHSVPCISHGVSELKARWILWEMNLQVLKMRNTEDHKDCTICATLLYCTEGQLQMKFCVEWKLANPKLIACSWHSLVFQGGHFDLWLTSFSSIWPWNRALTF